MSSVYQPIYSYPAIGHDILDFYLRELGTLGRSAIVKPRWDHIDAAESPMQLF